MPISTLKRQLMTMIIVKMWIESIYKKELLVQALLLKSLNNFIDYNLLTPENYKFSGVVYYLQSYINMSFN